MTEQPYAGRHKPENITPAPDASRMLEVWAWVVVSVGVIGLLVVTAYQATQIP